jgi:hypothetical protein
VKRQATGNAAKVSIDKGSQDGATDVRSIHVVTTPYGYSTVNSLKGVDHNTER